MSFKAYLGTKTSPSPFKAQIIIVFFELGSAFISSESTVIDIVSLETLVPIPTSSTSKTTFFLSLSSPSLLSRTWLSISTSKPTFFFSLPLPSSFTSPFSYAKATHSFFSSCSLLLASLIFCSLCWQPCPLCFGFSLFTSSCCCYFRFRTCCWVYCWWGGGRRNWNFSCRRKMSFLFYGWRHRPKDLGCFDRKLHPSRRPWS